MDKQFNFNEKEKEIYSKWEKSGSFKPLSDKQKTTAESFTIVMPPPNVTGQLHVGHALNNTMQDFVIRYKRMNGFNTLWVPGTDHASIATEVKVIEKLAKQGLTKKDLGREGFLKHAWEWKETYGNKIVEQLKTIGCSCDWSRLAFTMDEQRGKAVLEVFKKLYDDKLIYKGDKIINWCPCCKTALSDAEVDHTDTDSNFWHIRYPYADNSGKYLVVATTRPETLFGDSAVAVNPTDPRFKDLIGKTLRLPLTDRVIPVIADEYVDKDFGTGAVKITPAHDPNDFEVGMRHNLERIRVMNDDGTMNAYAGRYEGLDRIECRKQMIADLKTLGLLEKIEPHVVSRGECYRCHTAVEPILSKQWFVSMLPLAKPAVDAVKTGELLITPKRVEKIYLNWLENVRDWCISRQLWWGHRIPAYYCDECGNTMVETTAPIKCSKCGSTHMHQDEDVLDTWFSSGLWPFSTLGYPENTEDLKTFFPTSTLITAQDIIYFWVARMVMLSKYTLGKLPFNTVIINGLVRDDEGKKMSKSSANGVDPIEMVNEFGADALRFSLMFGNGSGNDFRFSREKITDDRKFINKVWNASKFVEMCRDQATLEEVNESKLNLVEKWIIAKFEESIENVKKNIDGNDYCLAIKEMYDFVWDNFCDWYIEMIKPYVYSENQEIRNHSTSVLVYLLKELLKFLHPIIPFITEEIYSNFADDLLINQAYAKMNFKGNFASEKAELEKIIEIIKKIREFRLDMQIPASKKVSLVVCENKITDKSVLTALSDLSSVLTKTANLSCVEINKTEKADTVSFVTIYGELFMNKSEVIDKEKELARLNKELAVVVAEIETLEVKLANPNFVNKAPANVVEAERTKFENDKKLKVTIEEKLNNLK